MIEAERLLLLRPRLEDAEPLRMMWADPEVTRHIAPVPLTRGQAWATLLSLTGHWELLGYGGWIVCERSTGAFVGQVGFQHSVRNIDTAPRLWPEAGWVLRPAMWGRGYALEAIRACLIWSDEFLDAATTVAIINERNAASLRLAAKVGYEEISRGDYGGALKVVFERARQV